MSVAPIAPPPSTDLPLPTSSEENTRQEAPQEVCSLCGGPAFRVCEACEKAVCKKCHRAYLGFCQVERDYCPGCYQEKVADVAAFQKLPPVRSFFRSG